VDGGEIGEAKKQRSKEAKKQRTYTEVAEDTELTEKSGSEKPKSTLGSNCASGFASKRKATERSLHYAARRATIRRGRESRAAPVGMTSLGRGDLGGRTGRFARDDKFACALPRWGPACRTPTKARATPKSTVLSRIRVDRGDCATEREPKTQVKNRTWGTRQPKTQVKNRTWGTRQEKGEE